MGQSAVRTLHEAASTSAVEHLHIAKRLPWPASAGWHSHRRVQWISAGRGFATLETEEGQWAVFPGHAIIVASEVPHDLRWHGAAEVASVYLEPGAVAFAPQAACRYAAVSPLLDAAVAALVDEDWPYETGSRAGLLASVILEEMSREERAVFGLPMPVARALRTLCRQLREDPADPRDIDAWAAAVGTSRRTLTRHFRNETGLSFVDWRRRARVIHAHRRAADGSPPKQAAKEAGYASVQAMRTEMRRVLEDRAVLPPDAGKTPF